MINDEISFQSNASYHLFCSKYQFFIGFVPQKPSEANDGIDLPPSLRFTTTSQATYVDQMQYQDPLDDIVAPSVSTAVPAGDAAKFYGQIPDDEETLAKDAENFYGDGSLYRAKVESKKETLDQATAKFHFRDDAPVQTDPVAWKTMTMSYAEAKGHTMKQ